MLRNAVAFDLPTEAGQNVLQHLRTISLNYSVTLYHDSTVSLPPLN